MPGGGEQNDMKKRIKAGLVVLVLSMGLTVSVIAGPSEDGMDAYMDAYKRKDYATALQLLRRLAEQGNPAAMHSLGSMYENGESVPQSYAEAVKWYRKAAEQGTLTRVPNLGVCYT